MAKMAGWLTPNLADTMPSLAKAVPWLFLFDGALYIGSLVIMHLSINWALRLTPEMVQKFKEQKLDATLLEAQRWLVRSRYVFVGSAVVIGVSWAWLWRSDRVGSEFTELVFVVIYGGLLIPLYIIFGRLAKTLAMMTGKLG